MASSIIGQPCPEHTRDQRAYEAAHASIDWPHEVASAAERITVSDLLDELTDWDAILAEAIKRDDEAQIGRIVLDAREAYACRLAARENGVNLRGISTSEVMVRYARAGR